MLWRTTVLETGSSMKTVSRMAPQRLRDIDHPTKPRRSADVLGVYDNMTEAGLAASILASRGIPTSRISLVSPPASVATDRAGDDMPRMVLLHGRLEDTDRAHEILADEAARVHDLELTTA